MTTHELLHRTSVPSTVQRGLSEMKLMKNRVKESIFGFWLKPTAGLTDVLLFYNDI